MSPLQLTLVLVILCGYASGARHHFQRQRTIPYRREQNDASVEERLTAVEDMLVMVKDSVNNLIEINENPVVAAFTAFLPPDNVTTSAGDVILFTRVADFGDVFDLSTGTFNPPVNGVYTFGVSFKPFDVDSDAEFAAARVIKRCPGEEDSQVGLVTSSDDAQDFDVSFIRTVIYLEIGCEVFLMNDVSASFTGSTAFTGFLIQEVTIPQ